MIHHTIRPSTPREEGITEARMPAFACPIETSDIALIPPTSTIVQRLVRTVISCAGRGSFSFVIPVREAQQTSACVPEST
jgi:hypothetical protein